MLCRQRILRLLQIADGTRGIRRVDRHAYTRPESGNLWQIPHQPDRCQPLRRNRHRHQHCRNHRRNGQAHIHYARAAAHSRIKRHTHRDNPRRTRHPALLPLRLDIRGLRRQRHHYRLGLGYQQLWR